MAGLRRRGSPPATSGRGGVRETGHGGGVGEHRGVARALAHLVGQVGGAGEAGARRSKARGGGRSSASSGNGLRGTGRPPEGLGGTLVALGARWDARFGRRRAETATATWTAARGSGRGGEEGYGVRAVKRRGGSGGGAHRGCSGSRSGLGDALKRPERRWGSTAAGDGKDDGGGSTGRPEGHGLTERWWTTWRGYRTRSEGEGEVVAAATASGGVGGVRP